MPDLAVILSDVPAASAAVYTQNLVKGAPIYVTKAHLQNGVAQAIICNSGNANTCNTDGMAVADTMCDLTAAQFGINAQDVIIMAAAAAAAAAACGCCPPDEWRCMAACIWPYTGDTPFTAGDPYRSIPGIPAYATDTFE